MKLWVDSRRQPTVDWVWSQTAGGAIALLGGGCVERISLPPERGLRSEICSWIEESGHQIEIEVHDRRTPVRLPLIKVRYKEPVR